MKAGFERVLVKRAEDGPVACGVVEDFSPGGKMGMRMGPGARVWYRAADAVKVGELDSLDEKNILAWDRAAVAEVKVEEVVEQDG